MAAHVSGACCRKTKGPKLHEIAGALADRRQHHRHADMRARLQRAGKREEASCCEQVTADFIKRQDNEIGARQVQKRERTIKQASSQLQADQHRDPGQTQG